ncbi:hypothetical protein FS837_011852 [Tulasnella sp. UAMH 9824]|nr:hypothetical protein FS837_011852 [Tulasnella sp. UAMH 9824]
MHPPLRPPPPGTVGQAISLLLGSVRGRRDASESNPIEDSEEREIAELELAASVIHEELLLRAATLQRQHNSSQWIYRLPQEVFTEILIFDILNSPEQRKRLAPVRWNNSAEKPKPPRRTQLCNVSHRLLQTIMSTPRIWSDIRWGVDDHIRCLEMSAQAPLSIQCSRLKWMEVEVPESIYDFSKAVEQQSWRWKSLSLHLPFRYMEVPFLEFTALQLRDLTIQNTSSEPGGIHGESDSINHIIKIFGNPALRNLSLDGMGLYWNNLNLSHLRSLSLIKVKEGAPRFEKLMEILQAASGLEQLTLHGLNIPGLCSIEEQEWNTQPIHLTSLLSVCLDELAEGLADHLIRHARFPRLKSIRVHGLFLKHLKISNSDQNPYHHFFQVIIPVLSSSTKGLTLSNGTFSNEIYLNTDRWAMPWPDGDAAGKTADFGVVVGDPLSSMQQMVDFIKSNRILVPLTIVAHGFDYALNTISSTPSFPAEVLGELPMVTKISAAALDDALNIMALLETIRRDEETGRLGWACPRLKDLDFSTVEGVTPERIQAFLDARYGDGNPLLVDGEIVDRPPMVEFAYSIFWETSTSML